MRRSVRALSDTSPSQRLAATIAELPPVVGTHLVAVASRTDLPLAAGSWRDGDSGCLVANVVATVTGPQADAPRSEVDADGRTLDLQVLDAVPQMSSRDLNALVVAWDEAADAARATDDAALRELLRAALVRAGRYDAAPVTPDSVVRTA